MKKLIKERESKKLYFTINGVNISIKDKLTPGVNIRSIINKVFSIIPKPFLQYIDIIYIGDFDMLKDNDFGAVYDQRAIYLSNNQVSEADCVAHVVHEFAHAIEQNNYSLLYSDGLIEEEFLNKREKVQSLLSSEGYEVPLNYFYNLEYDKEFDNFLYNDIGYPMLAMLTTNVFYSPYAITSVNEYFANTFEIFYNKKEFNFVKKISPAVYRKIMELEENNEQ